MSDFRLSKVQRNELAELAKKNGLDLGAFVWSEQDDGRGSLCSTIRHNETGGFMTFEPFTGDAFWLKWWPNFTGTSPYESFRSWQEVRQWADRWFQAVAAEAGAADVWSTAQAERAWADAGAGGRI